MAGNILAYFNGSLVATGLLGMDGADIKAFVNHVDDALNDPPPLALTTYADEPTARAAILALAGGLGATVEIEAGLGVIDSTVAAAGVTPAHTLVFEGTLTAAHNTNTNADVNWDDTVDHADVTHTDGQPDITLAAGEYDFYFNMEVTDGAGNNRQTWALDLRHRDAADGALFTYRMASASYIRDDAATYDTGLCAGHFNLVVADGEDVTLQTAVLDAQTAAGVNNADPAVSYLRIFKKTYS